VRDLQEKSYAKKPKKKEAQLGGDETNLQ
jgi:hypothetical protein